MKQTTPRPPQPTPPQAVPRVGFRRAWDSLVTWRGELAALIVFTFILIARAPWVLVLGRFWAEEATVFLSYAWTHPFLDALTATHEGYYNFVPNLVGILGAHIPLEWAPRVTVAIGLPIQLLPATLILFTSIPGLTTPMRKGAALLLLLAVPANPEVLLNTANSHMVLCAATGLILVSDHAGRADRIGKWLLLGLAGLTGVVSTFLTPLFWLEWWKERRRERLVQAAILTSCALLQLVFISRALTGGERNLRFDPAVMAGAAYGKFLLTPLSPAGLAFRHLEQLKQHLFETGALPLWVWLLTTVVFAGYLVVCWRSGRRAALLLAAAGLWVALLSFAATTGPNNQTKLLANLNFGLRYYYAPQFMFFLALLVCVGPGTRLPRWLQSVSGVWLAAVLLMGLFNFACAPLDWPQIFFGPPWAQQVEHWRQDPSKPLAIWPNGWQVTLPPKP